MQWSHDADAKLFMHVLKIHDVKVNYTALATAMGNDVTPKAITHRIAKLRSMADDASTPTAGANSNSSPPKSTKRTSPTKRTPATTAPASKKPVATPAHEDPVLVTGTKRNAAGTAKQGTTASGKAANDANAVDDDEGDAVAEVKPSVNKKIKTSDADVKNGIKVLEDGSAATATAAEVKPSVNKKMKSSNADVKNGIKVLDDGSAGAVTAAVDEDGGVEYAA